MTSLSDCPDPKDCLQAAVGAPTTLPLGPRRRARIDALVDLVGELIVAKNNLGHLAAQAADAASPLASALAANYAGFERLTGDMHRTVMRMRMIAPGANVRPLSALDAGHCRQAWKGS